MSLASCFLEMSNKIIIAAIIYAAATALGWYNMYPSSASWYQKANLFADDEAEQKRPWTFFKLQCRHLTPGLRISGWTPCTSIFFPDNMSVLIPGSWRKKSSFQPKVSSSIFDPLISSFLSAPFFFGSTPSPLLQAPVPPPYKDARCPWLLNTLLRHLPPFVSLLTCWFGHLFCSFVSFWPVLSPVPCEPSLFLALCGLGSLLLPPGWAPGLSHPFYFLPGAVPWVARWWWWPHLQNWAKIRQILPRAQRWLKQGSQGRIPLGLEFCSARMTIYSYHF